MNVRLIDTLSANHVNFTLFFSGRNLTVYFTYVQLFKISRKLGII